MTLDPDIGWIGMPGTAPCTELHGRKAHLLGEAAAAGLSVPAGFVLPASFQGDVSQAMEALQAHCKAVLGDPDQPLLVSVRPSASMAAGGMAPAILDVGMCEAVLPAMSARIGARAALDLYRRAIQSFGSGAMGVEGEEFEYALHDALRLAGEDSETELDEKQLRALAETCQRLIEDESGEAYPHDPHAQLTRAIASMQKAWMGRQQQRPVRIPQRHATVVLQNFQSTGYITIKRRRQHETGRYGKASSHCLVQKARLVAMQPVAQSLIGHADPTDIRVECHRGVLSTELCSAQGIAPRRYGKPLKSLCAGRYGAQTVPERIRLVC